MVRLRRAFKAWPRTVSVWEGNRVFDLVSWSSIAKNVRTDTVTRLHACCNLSGLFVLLVNIIEFPDQPSVMSDWSLIVRMLSKFDQMNDKASNEPFFLLQVAHELDRKASRQVKRVAHMPSLSHQEAAFSEPWANPDLMFL